MAAPSRQRSYWRASSARRRGLTWTSLAPPWLRRRTKSTGAGAQAGAYACSTIWWPSITRADTQFRPSASLKIDEEPHCIQGSGHGAPRFWAKPQQFVQVTSGVIMLVGGSQPALSRCTGAGDVAILLSVGVTIGSRAGAFV